jgi:hypothetical protein
VSLCAPPTAITSSTGFNPTKPAAQRPLRPSRDTVRPINATAARLDNAAIAFNAHSPLASPSGAVA